MRLIARQKKHWNDCPVDFSSLYFLIFDMNLRKKKKYFVSFLNFTKILMQIFQTHKGQISDSDADFSDSDSDFSDLDSDVRAKEKYFSLCLFLFEFWIRPSRNHMIYQGVNWIEGHWIALD